MSLLPLFILGERLQLCASMVRPGAAMADIGTDHAYLPIWLAKQDLIAYSIAADVKLGPLQKAQINIQRYHVQNTVSARLSDGLNAIFAPEADDIVIAGMGGEMIIKIITDAPWLKDKQKHIILQPMTSAEQLREFLAEQGFAVLKEQAVVEDGRVYSALLAEYSTEKISVDELYPHIGKLDAGTPDNCAYIRRRVTNLEKRMHGLNLSQKKEEADALGSVIIKLNAMLKKE